MISSVNPFSQLSRQLEGGFDPVAIFREVAKIPCVSFSEYLMYRYLVSEFEKLRGELIPMGHQEKLAVGYSPAGQLLVTWRGRPDDNRRTVLVAHVDREGFLVRAIDRTRGRAVCWHTAGEPEPHIVGRRVILLCGDCTMTGRVETITPATAPASAQNPFDHTVEIAVDQTHEIRSCQIVDNGLFIGIGHYDIPAWDEHEGVIAATNVDNTAGVSVLVSVMRALIRGNWKVNVDCLFTTCEEAGFCGVVAEILDGSMLDGSAPEEVVCIVVDSSSHIAFRNEPESWDPASIEAAMQKSEQEVKQTVEIPLQDPVIRTGDGYSMFDVEVARLLWAAQSNLEGSSTSRNRDWIPARRAASLQGKLRTSLDGPAGDSLGGSIRRRGVIGRLVGGWCEATPLMLADEIRLRRGRAASQTILRVGSVAIPIAGYRNSFRKELQPEKCHESSLRGACQLLGEAVYLCHRWPFGLLGAVPRGVRPQIKEKRIGQLLAWQDTFKELSSVTTSWIRGDRRGRPGPLAQV